MSGRLHLDCRDRRPGDRSAGTVLIVDDDPSLLAMLGMALQVEGFEVRRATTGQQALAAIAESRPDVVVLDVMMPGLDGREVTRRLRNDPTTCDLPVVICSALSRDDDQWQAWTAGANSFVAKPFEIDALVDEVNLALELASEYTRS